MKILVFGDVSDWNIPDFSVDKIPESILDDIKSADLCVYNLEGPIGASNNPVQLRENPVKDWLLKSLVMITNKVQPQVFSSDKILSLLTLNPNTLVTLANNHVKDRGKKGLEKTIELLDKHGVKFTGAGYNAKEANKPKIVSLNNAEIGLLNYNFIGKRRVLFEIDIYGAGSNEYGASSDNLERIKDVINEVKSKTDILILIIHAGREMASNIAELGIPVKDFEKLSVDSLIIHHPHIFIDSPSSKLNVLGDLVFNYPRHLPDTRNSAYLEITQSKNNPTSTRIKYFSLVNGYPSK